MSWAGQASYRAASKNRVACEACGAMPPWPVMVIKSDARKGKRLGGVEYGITVDMQKWHHGGHAEMASSACTGM
jgi:hypothetical protein